MKHAKLAIGFHNGIGNWIMFTPTVKLLSEQFGKPDLILDAEWKERAPIKLLAEPLVNKIVDFHPGDTLQGYEAVFMSRHGVADAVFRAFYQELKLDDLPEWTGDYIHEIEWYQWEISQRFGLRPGDHEQVVPVGRAPRGLPREYIVISNGYLRTDDGLYARKSWKFWDELVDCISLFYGLPVIAIGGEDDKAWGESLRGVHNKCGEVDILQTAAIINKASAIVATDTSCMHIADALRIPGVAMFGPTLVSKNKPMNRTILCVRADMECAPCQGTLKYNSCSGGCMDTISPKRVMATLRRVL